MDDEAEIRIKEVYDLAYDVAQEFDKLVRVQDIEIITPLINKVIHALEMLENSISKISLLEKKVLELNQCVKQISAERSVSEHEKSKMKQTFEETEESWLNEFVNMKAIILQLKTENKLLRNQLSDKKEDSCEIGSSYECVIQDQENFIIKLQTSLQQKEKLLQKDVTKIDALKNEVEELCDKIKTLQMHSEEAKREINHLKKIKKVYEIQLNFQEQKIITLEQNLEEHAECHLEKVSDLASKAENPVFKVEDCLYLKEQEKLHDEISRLQLQLGLLKKQNEMHQGKIMKLTEQSTVGSSQISSMRQLFHLFLGFFALAPKTCWL